MSEPTTCAYVAVFRTPSACSPEALRLKHEALEHAAREVRNCSAHHIGLLLLLLLLLLMLLLLLLLLLFLLLRKMRRYFSPGPVCADLVVCGLVWGD